MDSIQIDFKSTEALFNKIKEDFSSFDNGSLLDSGRFYADVKYLINRLGISWYIPKEEILEVENFNVKLPKDFYQLDYALKCDCTLEISQTPGIVLTQQIFSKNKNIDEDVHKDPCDNCDTLPKDCLFNTYENILISRDNCYYRYSKPSLLKLGNVNTKKHCVKNCINAYSNSPHTISIENKRIYTNFKEGSIYLSYNSFPIDSETGLPLIPNNSIIEKCIEYYIKKNIIESLWVNSEADVQQKVSYFNQMYKESLSDAQMETKLPTFNKMVENIRRNRQSLRVYNQII